LILIFSSIAWLIGAISIVLAIRAAFKGKDYIAASNFGWNARVVDSIFRGSLVSKAAFRLTPIAIIITSGWAGFALINDLSWPLAQSGFIDRESGEWRGYRGILSAGLGAPLGTAFGVWFVSLCERNLSKELLDEELSSEDQLARIIGS